MQQVEEMKQLAVRTVLEAEKLTDVEGEVWGGFAARVVDGRVVPRAGRVPRAFFDEARGPFRLRNQPPPQLLRIQLAHVHFQLDIFTTEFMVPKVANIKK